MHYPTLYNSYFFTFILLSFYTFLHASIYAFILLHTFTFSLVYFYTFALVSIFTFLLLYSHTSILLYFFECKCVSFYTFLLLYTKKYVLNLRVSKYSRRFALSNTTIIQMATTISILNYKGGVGKTTTTAHLATALWALGKKVLVIDTDAQCNLSYQFDFQQGDETLHNWLLDFNCTPPVYKRYDGMYFIPSGRDSNFEKRLDECTRREERLNRQLSVIKDMFDYVLIDCSPKEGLINTNALAASDKVLIPVECSSFSMQGIQGILNSIEHVKRELNENLDIAGFLLVKFDKNTRIARSVQEYFALEYKDKLFRTVIRKVVKFDEAPMTHKTCFELAPDSNGAEDYMRLAEEMTGEKRPDNWKERIAEAWYEKHPEDRPEEETK